MLGHVVMRAQHTTGDNKFVPEKKGKLGTHSLRKGPSTYAGSICGQPKEYVTLRGRWRDGKRQVDTYIAIDRPYRDALIAQTLCGHKGSTPPPVSTH